MTHHRASADEDSILLRGQTPDGRPELQTLAQSLAEFRGAALGLAPRPSATLAARLESNKPLPQGAAIAIAPRIRRPLLIARIAAASAALLIVFGALGSAHALPPAAQVVFDQVVSSVLPGDDVQPPLTPAVPIVPTTESEVDESDDVPTPAESDTDTDTDTDTEPEAPSTSPKPTPKASESGGNDSGNGSDSDKNNDKSNGGNAEGAPGDDKKDE